VATAVVFGSQIFGAEEEPAATPTSIESPTEEAPPAAPPPTETPTAEPPTDTPPVEAPIESPPTSAFDAQVSIAASATELRVGDPLNVNVTIVNTGQVVFGNLQYQLLGQWEPCLRATETVIEQDIDVGPGLNHTVTFVLEAMQDCTARLEANVIVKTREEQPSTRSVPSDNVVEVSVIQ